MKKRSRIRWPDSISDNRKSKTCTVLSRSIQNPKWVGFFALVMVLGMCGAVAEAQQANKVPRIGYLRLSAGPSERVEAFRQGLRELGYVEGRNMWKPVDSCPTASTCATWTGAPPRL